jgi:hypothetical protein
MSMCHVLYLAPSFLVIDVGNYKYNGWDMSSLGFGLIGMSSRVYVYMNFDCHDRFKYLSLAGFNGPLDCSAC